MIQPLWLVRPTDHALAGLRQISPRGLERLIPTIAERQRMRVVHQGLESPGRVLLGPRWRQGINLVRSVLPTVSTTGEVWAVTMVKDDCDIVGFTIEHLLAEGVDHVLVADNLSTDGTGDLLADLARHHPVTVVRDREVAYYQAEKMTSLARLATRAGAEWILPFDADEYWRAPSGPLGELLRRSSSEVLAATIFDHVPDPTDPSPEVEPNPFHRLRYRSTQPDDRWKVAFRAHPLARLRQGNHSVARPGRLTVELEVRHFPYRSYEQFARKRLDGAKALLATDLESRFGWHWRDAAGLGEDALFASWEEWRSQYDLVLDPVP